MVSFTVPSTGGGPEAHVRLQLETPLTLASGYAYWSAPRRVELASIDVDVSAFPNAEHYGFTLQPMLSGEATIDHSHPTYWNVAVDRWVDAGAGVVLMWRPK